MHQWHLAELSYPQLAPAEMGRVGSTRKNCSNTEEEEKLKESKKPLAGWNRNREEGVETERARQREQEQLGVQVYQNMT